MTTVRGNKRKRIPTRSVDLAAIRELLSDGCPTKLGLVVERDGSHFEITEDDVLLRVDLVPEEIPVDCRLAQGAGAGLGFWAIPGPGTEVAVIIPDNDARCGPVVVGILSSGGLPDGVGPNVTVIAMAEVLIHDGAGGAEPLPTLAEFKQHVVQTAFGPSGPPIDPIPGLGPITGTTVLKAK